MYYNRVDRVTSAMFVLAFLEFDTNDVIHRIIIIKTKSIEHPIHCAYILISCLYRSAFCSVLGGHGLKPDRVSSGDSMHPVIQEVQTFQKAPEQDRSRSPKRFPCITVFNIKSVYFEIIFDYFMANLPISNYLAQDEGKTNIRHEVGKERSTDLDQRSEQDYCIGNVFKTLTGI